MYEILTYPKDALLLRRKAVPVTDAEFGTPALLEFCARLGETMMGHRGLGLASTQVDAGTPWAVIALRVGDASWGAVCNPEILRAEDERVGPEGCLSFASVVEPMLAPSAVQLLGKNPRGVGFIVVYEEQMARCVYHECQHLVGRTMIDRMSPLKRAMFLKRVAKARGK